MSEPENNTTPATPAQPVFPPIDATKAVPPVTPFPAWTWNTPVIPQFYWNVYSSEQRIRQICVEIGRIQAYLEYFAANSNAAHWYLDSRFTQVETRLTARVGKLEKELGEEVARLDKALADETKNRTDGDKALQARIDATKTALEAETTARVAGDKANADAIAKETADREAGDAALRTDVNANAKAIAKETADRKAGDDQLTGALATESATREHADTALGARIDAETAAREAGDKANADAISGETADRKAGDSALRTDVDADKAAIAKETADRKAGDDQLTDDLATETNARTNADTALGGRIDAEATARQDADTHLGERIVAEHTERAHDVQTLTTGMNHRPLATAITAKEGSGVTVESKETDDGSGTGVVIGSTWEGDFATLQTGLHDEASQRMDADGALQAKLDAETGERRHDDAELGRRIDGKLAFGAVRAGDGITVVNDPDTTTATVSAEVTKAKLDAAIAGIHEYELPTATSDRLGGVKVGTGLTVTDDGTLNATATPGTDTGLETVGHDNTMTGLGTPESPLSVKLDGNGGLEAPDGGLAINKGAGLALADNMLYVKNASATELGGIKVGTGLTVTPDGTLNADAPATTGLDKVSHDTTMEGDGTAGNPLKVSKATATTLGGVKDGGNGVHIDYDGYITANPGKGLSINTSGELEAYLGDGLGFDSRGAITATGAAGTSESVKVVYPNSTRDKLGVNDTSGRWSVGEFLNFLAGVDEHGLPKPRFNVKSLEITKKQLMDAKGRGFLASDFTTVTGGFFNGTTALKQNLSGILHQVFAPYSYKIASIIVVDFNANDMGSMVIDGNSIITYFTATDGESLANTLNSIADNTPIYELYCVTALRDEDTLDIYSRYN